MKISSRILLPAALGCALGCGPKGDTNSPNVIDSAVDDVSTEVEGADESADRLGDDVGTELDGVGETAEDVGGEVGDAAGDVKEAASGD